MHFEKSQRLTQFKMVASAIGSCGPYVAPSIYISTRDSKDRQWYAWVEGQAEEML